MNSLFGMLCTLCCMGSMVLDEETGNLVCTHHEVLPDGSLASCGHTLRDTQLIRMLLSANALTCSGRIALPGYAISPLENRKQRKQVPVCTIRHLSLYDGLAAYPLHATSYRRRFSRVSR